MVIFLINFKMDLLKIFKDAKPAETLDRKHALIVTVQAYVEVIKELYSLKSVEERWAILKRCESEDLSLEH